MSRIISARKRKPEELEDQIDCKENKTKKSSLSSKVAALSSELNSPKESKSSSSTKQAKSSAQNEVNIEKCFWLMKSEPESRIENGHEMKFGLDDLKSSKDQTTHWDGVNDMKLNKRSRNNK
jgi:hypothetical protein